MFHKKDWFMNRIGKRVFRDNDCSCNDCKTIAKEGLVIHDESQAEYMYTVQCDFMPDFELNYRDKL